MADVTVNGVRLHVEEVGAPPPGSRTALLLHGFPHTWRVWSQMVDELAADHRVVAPDLRGFGESTLVDDGLDAATLAADLEMLVLQLGLSRVTAVAIDAAVPAAFLLALQRPELIDRLVLVESTLGTLPGAEDFFAGGPPWWFGFHAVPGLAESVLAGHEAEYVGWFYDQGTRGRGLRPDLRDAFGRAYSAPGALRSALALYRSMPRTSDQLSSAVASSRLVVPTTAVGAATVGRALESQLRPVTDDLVGHLLTDCGHIVPVDQPERLLAVIRDAEAHGAADHPGAG